MLILRRVLFLCLLLVTFFNHSAWSRAGGAGGGSHSSGGSRSSGSSHSSSYHGGSTSFHGGYSGSSDDASIVFSLSLIVIIVIVILTIAGKNSKKLSKERMFRQKYKIKKHQQLMSHPLFSDQDKQSLVQKVTHAFLTIEQAWSDKRLDSMRRFISDGVYQRFHAQYTMMNLLEQKNPMSNVKVLGVYVSKVEQEGGYDCVDVCIDATAQDQFICDKFKELNSVGGTQEFTEYWSFIRRSNYKHGHDIFNHDTCPQCAAPITGQLVEYARCPYCGTYINNGEYDWVLAEITQDADYQHHTEKQWPTSGASKNQIVQVYKEFSRFTLEDRASNIFMQALIGIAQRDLNTLMRFSTQAGYQSLQRQIKETPIAYNRLYTQSVDFLAATITDSTLHAYVSIKYSSHMIELNAPTLTALSDNSIKSNQVVLLLVRTLHQDAPGKGSIYAGTCPHCGAPQKDSLSSICAYCHAALNDARYDFVLDAWMSQDEFNTLLKKTSV